MSEAVAAQPDRPRLSGRALAFALLVLLAAAATRFWALGERPLHHDESIHAYQSWTLSKTGDWRYDPAYHGPFLYYANALVYKIFGATDFTARLMPALFGLILIAFAFPLRRWIGNGAAAMYAVLVLTSPHFSYFSRFIREDVYSLVFTLGTILTFQRFLETDRSKWLMLAATAFALAGTTKENAYMTGVLFVVYALWALAERVAAGRPRARELRTGIADTGDWLRAHWMPILSSGVLFLVIWAGMYTAFGRHPRDWFAIRKAVDYWMGQHAIARIPGPWYYYFPQILYYETAILLAAAFAFPRPEWRRDPLLRFTLLTLPAVLIGVLVSAFRPGLESTAGWAVAAIAAIAAVVALAWRSDEPPSSPPLVRFFLFWTIGSVAIYAWAREKVPWLTVHPLLPLTILAAVGVDRLWRDRRRLGARIALVAIGLLLLVNTSALYLANVRYGAYDTARVPKHGEYLAYVQTTNDLVRALDPIWKAKDRVPAGQPVVTVAGESAWPLTWYLREPLNVRWASRIDQASTPVIIADWEPEGSLEKQLAEKYDARRVPIRAWWFPEIQREAGRPAHPTLSEWLRWWLFHELWSPIGSQDATVFVRKDLAGTGPLEPLAVEVQDTSARDYPAEAVALPPARVTGGRGSGAGQFEEPRGLATNARGNLYVADTKNHRVQVLDGNGAPLASFGTRGSADGQLNEPCGVAVGPDGEIYVADTWNHRIARFGPGGEWRGAWSDPDRAFFGPRAVLFSRGSVYVSDTGNKRIVRFGPDGKVTGSWGSAGSEPGQFIEPVGLAADSAGNLYVADTGNHRVQVFDADGKFLRQFPVYGWKDFYTEPYLTVGPGDSVLLTDSWKSRIAHYDASGALVRSFTAEGLKRPTGIALDPYGRVTVSDRETSRLMTWSLTDLLK